MIRHGQSIYQSLKIVSGTNEFGLSGLGKVQSKKIGEVISGIRFDHIYCSDLKRCTESYSLIEQQLIHKPKDITYTSLLRERDSGEDQLKSYHEVYRIKDSSQKLDKIQVGERTEEIQIRAQSFIKQLITDQLYKRSYQNLSMEGLNKLILGSQMIDKHQSYKMMKPYLQAFSTTKEKTHSNVLVVSHAGFITETLLYLYQKLGYTCPDPQQPAFYAKNGALFLVDIDANGVDDWKCEVSLRNFSRCLQPPFEHIY